MALVDDTPNELRPTSTSPDGNRIILWELGDASNDVAMLPTDGDPESLRRTALSTDDLKDYLGDSPAKVMVFMDACHSGQAAWRRVDNTEAIRELTSDEFGLVVMASSTGDEVSIERPEWGHGAFTKALIEGLEGRADYSGDGIVHLSELNTYVAERVKTLSKGKQHTTFPRRDQITRFPLFQHR